jgi:membrane protein required for colicin V production
VTIYDWAVIAIVAVSAIRGWRRGLVREAIDVALILVGTLVAFRLSPAVGTVVAGMANVPYEVGRVVAGVVIFAVLVVGSIVLGRVVSTALKVAPGATTLNRLGGSVIGIAYAAIVVVLATSIAAAVPLPADTRGTVDEAIGASAIGSTVVDPTGPIQPSLTVASGAAVVTSVIAVRDAIGDRLVAGTIPVPFPAAERSDLAPSQVKAQAVFDELNLHRISSGADPLAWSSDLAVVAMSRATDVYLSGLLSLEDDLPDALRAGGVPGTIADDLVVLAATPDGVVEAIIDAPAYEAVVVDRIYRKAGIGVVDGPYGLVAVQVVSG